MKTNPPLPPSPTPTPVGKYQVASYTVRRDRLTEENQLRLNSIAYTALGFLKGSSAEEQLMIWIKVSHCITYFSIAVVKVPQRRQLTEGRINVDLQFQRVKRGSQWELTSWAKAHEAEGTNWKWPESFTSQNLSKKWQMSSTKAFLKGPPNFRVCPSGPKIRCSPHPNPNF